MRQAIHARLGAVVLSALIMALAALTAGAQTTTAPLVIVVDEPVDETYANLPHFDDIEEAVDAAIALSQDEGRTITVLVTPRKDEDDNILTWPGNITIDETADIEVVGTDALPDEIIVESRTVEVAPSQEEPAGAVFRLSGASANVVIEGLTIRGGRNGVEMVDECAATVSRCFIEGSNEDDSASDEEGHGVFMDGGPSGDPGTPVVVNCIIRNNEKAGVYALRNVEAMVAHCTIYGNDNQGVYTDTAMQLMNCLIYENGTGEADDAGISWQTSATGWEHSNNAARNDPENFIDNGSTTWIPSGWPYNCHEIDVYGTDGIAGTVDDLVNEDGRLTGQPTATSTEHLFGRGDSDTSAIATRFRFIDIDGGGRPAPWAPNDTAPGDPDIGADEYNDGAAALSWYYVNVVPAVAGAYFRSLRDTDHAVIGRLTEDTSESALIEVRIQGGTPDQVFLTPQGADPLVSAERITLERIGGGGGHWLGTLNGPFPPANWNVDGHAYVNVLMDGKLFGEDIGSLTEEVKSQRHFLIDTTPPQLQSADAFTTVVLPTHASALVRLQNLAAGGYLGTYGALGLGALPTANHPYPALPTDWRPYGLGAAPYFPFDDGRINTTPNSDKGAQAFFNVASISNGYPLEPLNIQIVATFADTLNGEGPADTWTGQPWRQSGGFPEGRDIADPDDDFEGYGGTGEDATVQWEFVDNTQGELPTGVQVRYDFLTHGATSPRLGYDFGDPDENGGTVTIENDETTATWRFETVSGPVDGITLESTDQDHMHLAIKFIARDLAGNETVREALIPVDETVPQSELALDPLHVWWMRQARTRVVPVTDKVYLDRANFTWELRRGFEPEPEGLPQPLYTYRIWKRTAAGEDEKEGTYAPAMDWREGEPKPWSTETGVTSAKFKALDDSVGLTGHWVLLYVAGADEAGNVEPWPYTELALDVGGTWNVVPAADGGSNWVRFYVEEGVPLDTAVRARFWYAPSGTTAIDDTTRPQCTLVGENRIVAVPKDGPRPDVVAEFFLTPDFDPDNGTSAAVRWELIGPDGTAVLNDGGTGLTTTKPNQPLKLVINMQPYSPTETAPDPVTLVLRAWTVQQLTSGGTAGDVTPANLQFTLVYESVEEFMSPKDAKDDQPIKVQERD